MTSQVEYTFKKAERSDELVLNLWAVGHGLSAYFRFDVFPDESWLVLANGTPCGFSLLLQTDGAPCFLESLIVDPKCDKMIRRQGMTQLIGHLTRRAAHLGYSLVICSTPYHSLVESFKEEGFKEDEHKTSYLVKGI